MLHAVQPLTAVIALVSMASQAIIIKVWFWIDHALLTFYSHNEQKNIPMLAAQRWQIR